MHSLEVEFAFLALFELDGQNVHALAEECLLLLDLDFFAAVLQN